MKEVLMKLVENLADVMNVYQPILFMDTAPSHLHASLFDYLGRNGIFLGFVPSAMTWLLQVLDFSVLEGFFIHLGSIFEPRIDSRKPTKTETWRHHGGS